jgi:hypothetical protein
MRSILLTLNALVVLFFTGFLIYTIFAQAHVESLARGYVTERTAHYARPLVDLTEEVLKSRTVQILTTPAQRETVEREIAAYRKGPTDYVQDLTRQRKVLIPVEHPHPIFQKVAEVKEKIRDYYDSVMAALVWDLRIFAGSNLVAGLLALGIVFWEQQRPSRWVLGFSMALFLAVLYCSWMYVDEMTFFKILAKAHFGWWYPVILFGTSVKVWWEEVRDQPDFQDEEKESAAQSGN